jgi:DNA repair exonuclease SbcCD ATPase subunit
MADVEERLDRIEQELKGVGQALGELKGTQQHQGQTLERQGQTLTRHGELLERQGQTLERHERILERQGQTLEQHGRLLAQIVEDIQPLKALPDFVKRVADDHELRITELEKARRA